MKKFVLSGAFAFLSLSLAANGIVTDTTGFRTAASGNVAELLRGHVAGVRVSSIDGNPAGAVNINIRGINSIRTDNQPLYIIDGAPVSLELGENLNAFWQYGERSYTAPLNPLAFLNAYDIESIEVLKDASATALYGTRGANGVIIITTRKGARSEKAINLSSNAGLSLDASGTGLKPALSHNHYIGLGGTSKGTSYNISGALRNISGTIPGTHSNYYSFKGNFETKANSFLWFGLNTIVSNGKTGSPTGTAYLGHPSATLALRNPAFSPSTTFDQWLSDYDDDSRDSKTLASTFVQFNFTKSLSLRLEAGMDFQQNTRTIWYDNATDLGAPAPGNEHGGAAAALISQILSYDVSAALRWNRYFHSDHHLAFTLAAQCYGGRNRFNTMNGVNYVSHSLRGNGLPTGSFIQRNHYFAYNHSHTGAWSSLAYDFKGIFGINGSVRADNTPKYGRQEANIYPAAEAFLDIHKALLNSRAVSSLLLKGGWGVSGKEKYVPYELFGNYLSSEWPVPENGTEPFFDGLESLRTAEWHVSLEAGFLDGRLKAGAGFFSRNTQDSFRMYQMGYVKESSKTWRWGGFENVFERTAVVSNKGYEFTLDALVIDTGALKWNLSANLAYSANAMTGYDPKDFHGKKVGSDIFVTCNALNLPVSSLYGYDTDAAGKLVDRTGDGLVSEADMVQLGSTVPVVYGGLQTSVSLKGLTFEAALDGAAGHKIANLNAFLVEGTPGPDGKAVLTGNFVEKGDYLRLSELAVKYAVPIRIKGVKALEFRASVHNVLTFSGYSGWNPDVNCFGITSLSNGIDYGSYPLSRMIMAGLTAKF